MDQDTSAFYRIIRWFVIALLVLFVASLIPPISRISKEQSKLHHSAKIQRSIILTCRSYAADWNGNFPTPDPSNRSTAQDLTSADAFNLLIPNYIDAESIFWFKTTNPAKQKRPKEDENLLPHECSFGYVAGQTDKSPPRSPLTMDGEMSEPGIYGEHHPFLRHRKVVIGFCSGRVSHQRLTTAEPGATVMSEDREMSDIFQEIPEGLLATDRSNILLPK